VLRKWNRIFKSKDGHFLAILPGYLLRESWVWSFTRDQADVQVIEIYSNIFYPRSTVSPRRKYPVMHCNINQERANLFKVIGTANQLFGLSLFTGRGCMDNCR
jgi:hypothetical protein